MVGYHSRNQVSSFFNVDFHGADNYLYIKSVILDCKKDVDELSVSIMMIV